jgi:hypothetical protein
MQARCGLVALLLAAPRVAAAESPLRLSVVRGQGAGDCPDEAALSALVAALRRPDAAALPGAVLVDAQFVRDPAGPLRVTLNVSGARTGQRSLGDEGPACTELAEAAALSIAMLLDPQADRPPTASSAPTAASPAPPPVRTAPPPPVEPPARPRGVNPPLQVRAALGALVTTGQTASPAGGVAGEASVRWGFGLQLGLGVAWLPARTFTLAPGSLDVDLLAATVDDCWVTPVWNIYTGLCVRFGAGRYRARASGYTRNDEPTERWLAAGLLGRAGGPIAGPVGWMAQAGWMVPLQRRAFRIDGLGLAFDPGAAGGLWAGAGVEVRLW